MNNAIFDKTMENKRKRRNNNLRQQKGKKYLAAEPNFYTTKFFTENLLTIEVRKFEILMNKPVYLDLSILDLNKTVIYKFWYDYIKPEYGKNAKLCYMDTHSFIVYVKTDNICKDIAKDIKTRSAIQILI